MIKWTQAQKEAIHTEGSDILVAAAAGSGKTAVLVERIIQKLVKKEDPVDIDSLLVVTFTNAAAQEMRSRVGSALEKALIDDPLSMHLKKQLSLLQRSSISTLHAFCMDVVRQYSYLLDIDPAFRVGNVMEIDLIKQDTVNDLFEDWYGREGTEQESFFAVVDRFSSDRSDVAVEDLILTLYTFSVQNPWPEQWLDELAGVYEIAEDWNEAELSWLTIIKGEVSSQFKAIEAELIAAERLANESDGPYQYLETIEADKLGLEEALAKLDSWDDLQSYMESSKFVRLSGKKMECDADKRKQFQTLRKSYQKRWNDMKKSLFSRNLMSHIKDMREMAPVIRQLTELVKEFKVLFSEQKKAKALLDFSDLEHFCLELLLDESSTMDKPLPSSVAMHFKEKFSELLIDEYQDTNLVQETILTLISDQTGTGNMFMVGDVKQSIYGFRHAEPTLFIKKYKQFASQDYPAKRIDLASNFRSREQVLIGANYIFRQILDEKMGGVDYDESAELIYANKSYEDLPYNEPEPELLIIDREVADEVKETTSEDGEDFQDLEKAQLEARAYALKIKTWIGQRDEEQLKVVDKATGKQRDVQYRDIVILLRSMTWAPIIVDELKQQGIPVYAELSTGYFEAIEIKIMLSLLKIIDNPRQDIPLASVLRSPIVGLNEEELALIRLADKDKSFYEALIRFREQNSDDTAGKVTNFLEQLKAFRQAARQGGLSELIWKVYRESGYYDFVGGMPGGRQRQANLRALYDRSRGYESTSFRGLFRFLRFIERMEERGDDLGAARALSEQEDVIRIMTIHKSKGLEFPVVIMGGVDRQFNLQDLNKTYLLDKNLGFATKYIDPIKRITYPTLYYHALRGEKLREQLAEEIRVLYVALTRAKEKLVMVGNVASFEKKQEKWQTMLDHSEWLLPEQFRVEARTYLDWIGPALIRHESMSTLRGNADIADIVLKDIPMDPSKWSVTVIHGSELIDLEETTVVADQKIKSNIKDWQALSLDEGELESEVANILSYEYPFKEAVLSRAKQSVTEIKRQRELKDTYSSEQLINAFQGPIVKRPNFMQKDKQISSAEIGTIMHTMMQHLPLIKPLDKEEIEAYIETFIEREIITKEEALVVDIEAIKQFYQTDIAEFMLNGPEIYREVPFSLTLSASDVYATWENNTEEQVLIQGVIDCLIRKDDGWIILDYKTDAINASTTEEMLIKRYATQMEMYQHAVESIWKEPIKETYLYFFAKQLLVKVPK